MKITSIKPKGQRMFKCIKFKHDKCGKVRRPFWIEPIENGFWLDAKNLEWVKNPENLCGLTSSYYSMSYCGLNNVYSLKAVIRLIHKWKAPKGTKFRASLPFVGYDFIITKNN